jgi:glyoxylase-like metal-dependent hydrolase (beta-lactamase superfamily II)
MVEVVSVVDEGLGHSSYVVGLGDGTALVVDPARVPTRHRAVAAERGWRIAWTADTHSHADYLELGDIARASVPDGPLTVMCGHGERAMTGASILEARGHQAVSVLAGGPGDWSAATGTALVAQ